MVGQAHCFNGESCGDILILYADQVVTVVLFTAEGDEKRIGTMMPMSYVCDNIDASYDELRGRGVEFEGPPQKQPWGTYAMFKDSEGNSFVLSQDK